MLCHRGFKGWTSLPVIWGFLGVGVGGLFVLKMGVGHGGSFSYLYHLGDYGRRIDLNLSLSWATQRVPDLLATT